MSSRLPDIENLTDQQRDWVLHSEALWREAHSIAAENPGVDPGDVSDAECVLTVEVSGTHTDSARPIMPLDLSSLRDALTALNVSLRYLDSDSAADPGLRDQFRAAAIQAFEFTYELAFKFMKRQLAQIVPVPSAVDEMTFMQVVRAAAEAGLVTDVSRFHEYREARNITSHSYDRQKAQRIVAELPRFAEDVSYLLSRLEARNRAGD